VRSIFLKNKKRILLVSLSVNLLFFPGCRKATNTNETPVLTRPPQTTYPMPPAKTANPEMGWTVANSQHVRLSDLKYKVVILDFYATWCVPCRDSIPHLIDLHKRYGPKGLQVVGLNVGGPDDYEDVPAFARQFRISYQLGIPDPELENTFMGDDSAIPQTFVLDQNGAIVKRFIGYDDSLNEELESAIQESLAAAK
jgi:cytochrome c biogenesis protein CcmG/thiol:disulfide interchange protein DsbE